MLAVRLQRFAGERTERATPKRRSDARREGQIPKSAELTSSLGFLGAVIALRLVGPSIWSGWETSLVNGFSHLSNQPVTQAGWLALGTQTIWQLVRLVLPIIAVAGVVGLMASYAQVGVVFLPQLLLPKFDRIQPISGFKRLFSVRSGVEAIKSLLKLSIVGLVTWITMNGVIGQVLNTSDSGIAVLPALVGRIVYRLALEIGSMMLALSAADALWQRYEFERSIRMSKQDIRDERKQQEGDPKIKSNIRRRGYALAFRRMMQAVPQADVVITNPTHFAVALQYQPSAMVAPVVLAKGQDDIALRIRQVAQQNGVALVENRPLAQSLYQRVEIGQPVPKELYAAVAEVLAYVYRLKQAGVRG